MHQLKGYWVAVGLGLFMVATAFINWLFERLGELSAGHPPTLPAATHQPLTFLAFFFVHRAVLRIVQASVGFGLVLVGLTWRAYSTRTSVPPN